MELKFPAPGVASTACVEARARSDPKNIDLSYPNDTTKARE